MPTTQLAAILAGCFAWGLATAAETALYPPLRPLWELPSSKGFYAPPVAADGLVYAADVAGTLHAVELQSGRVRWAWPGGATLYAAPVVAGDLVCVASTNRTLVAIERRSGAVRWKHDLPGLVYAAPLAASGLIIVASGESGHLQARRVSDGELVWEVVLPARAGSGLALANDLLLVGSYDRQLRALELRTGRLRWQLRVETAVDSQPLVVGPDVYVKLTNDAVLDVRLSDGAVLWRTTPRLVAASAEPTTWSPLVAADSQLLTACEDGRLVCLDRTSGDLRWRTPWGIPRAAPPVAPGEIGFGGTKTGALEAIRLRDGAPLWDWQPAQPQTPAQLSGVMWPPVVAGQVVLVASLDGALRAFGAAAVEPKAPPALPPWQPGPGRIGLGGLFPMGYVGCLARHGLTREVLYDAQLTDLATLQRYDLLILAGSLADPAADRAIQEYVRQGGRVIVDYSASAVELPNLPARGELAMWMPGKSTAPGGFGIAGLAVTPWSPAAGTGPLAGVLLADGLVGEKALGYVPASGTLTDVQVLARYPATVQVAGASVMPAGGPGAPAILAGRLGRGTAILCGLQVGVKTEHSGLDLETLMLAMVKYLTAGRCEPQLRPDTPHIGYSATVSTAVAAGGEDPEDLTAVEDAPADPPAPAAALPRGWTVIEESPAPEWDLTAAVPTAPAALLVRYHNGESFARVVVGPAGLSIGVRLDGREQVVDRSAGRLPTGAAVTVKERCDRLLVQCGLTMLIADLGRLPAGRLAGQGWAGPVTCSPAESVYFSDDFMRSAATGGPWQLRGGHWSTAPEQQAERGANPFALSCQAGSSTATALAGDETWEEYRLTCAVRPAESAADGTIALGWYAQDEQNMYRLQATIQSDGQPAPAGWQLLAVQAGQARRLAACPGGVRPGQWYQVRVSSLGPRLTVTVDGVAILAATDLTYRQGGIALQVAHANARFDDVHVTAAVWPADVGARLAGRPPRHAGLIDVDSWASPATGWEPQSDAAGRFWRREVFFGDTDLDFRWQDVPDGSVVELLMRAEQEQPAEGYVLRLRRRGAAGELALLRDGKPVQRCSLEAGAAVHLGLQRRGSQLTGLFGGQPVLTHFAAALPQALRFGFAARGFLPQMAALTVWARQLLDLTFDTAPTDWWVSSGVWDLTNRWSCVPEWSWFGGYSEQTAAAWLKPEFAGDLVLDAYVGAKMLDEKVAGYRGRSQERTGDFNLTICGNGRDVESGYTLLVGPAGSARELRGPHGRVSGAGARLLRLGEVVARNEEFRLFSQGHNRWANLRVARRGAHVTLWVDGQQVLTYRDPQPLSAGYAAVWTRHNGILIPRTAVSFQERTGRVLSLPTAGQPAPAT